MDIKKIHMIGIKGVGMTMLAQFLVEKGYKISGSDTEEKFMTDAVLQKSGIEVVEKFCTDNIPQDTDLIIYSTAYNAQTNVELDYAFKNYKQVLSYSEVLGTLFKDYYGIAVVGSHGKTTTSAWLGFVLEKAGLEPNAMVGANVPQFNGNILVGKSDYLIIEADEYQNKLKYYDPKAVLLNNIDYDHPDFFKTRADYINVFAEFVKKIPESGFLVANFDDGNVKKMAEKYCQGEILSYSINSESDFVAYDRRQEKGKQFFKIKTKKHEKINEIEFSISLLGEHNIYNAMTVIISAKKLGAKLEDIKNSLAEFRGTQRRMQVMGEFNKALIIDDYAHHPTEIRATLAGIRENYKDKKITVVFHPHTFSRTKGLLNEFAQSFEDADKVIILDIYGSAREEQGGVHSRDLVRLVKSYKVKSQKSLVKSPEQEVLYIPSLGECEQYLRENICEGDVVVLMGAGNVFEIGENLLV